MHSSRFWLSTLIIGVLTACGSDDSPPPRDAGVGPDAYVQDSAPVGMGMVVDATTPGSMDAAVDAAPLVDASEAGSQCVPLGCQELGFECGQTMDNCGNPLNCNKPDNTSPCVDPQRCGGDPAKGANKCGCAPRANACEAQGAQCGTVDECGTPVDCGSCAGGTLCLNNLCACTPNPNPCGAKACGMAADGCGKMVACGASNGQCAVGACSAEGACSCRPREQACAGKTGAVTENGCTYNCDATCVPDNAAACAGAECGTATNNCGEVVSCGAAAGACAAGLACVSGQFIKDNALPARTAAYQGGYCVPTSVSKLLGKYAVRAHGFRQAGDMSLAFVNRAEAVSNVTISYTRSTQKAEMLDVGCVATTVSTPKFGLGAWSVIPNYRQLDPVTIELSVNGAQWTRPDIPHPVLGAGLPNGYTVGMPSFCAATPGQVVDLPANDPRRGTFWMDNKCQCPTVEQANALPPSVYSTMVSRDCRIIDSDKDGKPGFSAYTRASILTATVYNANVSHGVWTGTIRDDRHHIGTISERVQPLERSVLGCSAGGPACAAPKLDCGCPERLQPIYFVPLADDAALTCDGYYQQSTNPLNAVKQAEIDARFSVSYGACNGAGQCPTGTICRRNQCFPMTTPQACRIAGGGSPCGGDPNLFCEGCPAGMECVYEGARGDGACWPTAAVCPANMAANGGLCAAP